MADDQSERVALEYRRPEECHFGKCDRLGIVRVAVSTRLAQRESRACQRHVGPLGELLVRQIADELRDLGAALLRDS